jgi:hypothetical protein
MVMTSRESPPPMPSAASREAPRFRFPPVWVNRYVASTDRGPVRYSSNSGWSLPTTPRWRNWWFMSSRFSCMNE